MNTPPRPLSRWSAADFRRWPVWAGPGWSVDSANLEGQAGQDESSVQPLPGVARICDAPSDPVTVAIEATTAAGVRIFGLAEVEFQSYLTYRSAELLRFTNPVLFCEGEMCPHHMWREPGEFPLPPSRSIPRPKGVIFPLRYRSVAPLEDEPLEGEAEAWNDPGRCFPSVQGIYAVDADLLTELRQRRHLRRLVDVLAGKRDPADVGLSADDPVPALALRTPWRDIEDLLEVLTGPADRWRADLHRYYLRPIKHPRRRAGYWTAQAVAWTLGSFQRLAEGLLQRAQKAPPPAENLRAFTYQQRGRTEAVSNPVLGVDTLRRLRPELAMLAAGAAYQTLGDRAFKAGEGLWELAALLTEALGPQLDGGRQGKRWALVWLGEPTGPGKAVRAGTPRRTVQDIRPRLEAPADLPPDEPAPAAGVEQTPGPALEPQPAPSPLDDLLALLKRLERGEAPENLAARLHASIWPLSALELDEELIRRLVRALCGSEPDALLKVASALFRAPAASTEVYKAEIARVAPDWLAAHGDELDRVFADFNDPAGWR